MSQPPIIAKPLLEEISEKYDRPTFRQKSNTRSANALALQTSAAPAPSEEISRGSARRPRTLDTICHIDDSPHNGMQLSPPGHDFPYSVLLAVHSLFDSLFLCLYCISLTANVASTCARSSSNMQHCRPACGYNIFSRFSPMIVHRD